MKQLVLVVLGVFLLNELAIAQISRSRGSMGTRSRGPVGGPPAEATGMSVREQMDFLTRDTVQCRFVDDQERPAETVSSFISPACNSRQICIGNVSCTTGTMTFSFRGVACAADQTGQCLAPKTCVIESGFMDDVKLLDFNQRSNRAIPSQTEVHRAQ